jgi:3-oxoacyl-[acyl-carrier protein] reductase
MKGLVALVTGGAGGIGTAISRALAKEGCRVAIHYCSSHDRATLLKSELSDLGHQCDIFSADLKRNSDTVEMIASVVKRFGQLDILINNAGWSKLVLPGDLEGLSDDLINETLSLKIHSPIYTIRAAEKFLKQSANGVIINITSAAGYAARGSSIVYAAANAALYNLTKSFARILAPEIRVNAIAPGYVDTGFVFPVDGSMAKTVASQNYIGRCVTPENIAKTVVFLCRDGSSITGEEIIVDGGIAKLWKR